MKKIICILFMLIFINLFLSAQDKTIKREYKQAENLVQSGNIDKALEKYKEIIAKYPDNAHYNYKIGYLYFESSGYRDNALEYMEKASLNISKDAKNNYKETKAPIETWYFLGLLYHYNYEFEKAKVCFSKLLVEAPNSPKTEEVKNLIAACELGITLIVNPLDLDIIELGGNINSKYEEHSPFVTADLKTLIFTSKRKGTGDEKDDNGDYYEDIYISKFVNGDWTEPQSISENINTKDHEASSGLSYDGRTLFVYKPTNNGDIYVSYLEDETWTKPEPLSPFVNSEYRETSAALSVDGKTLYFTSERPGGLGGLDIYYSQIQEDGSWGTATNMGSNINSPKNEESPYLHPCDSIMYFSSNGHPGMGGYDLFMTIKQNDNWTKPTNIGYPINSPDNDVFFVSSPEGNYGFYASNQYGAAGTTNIYALKLPNKFKNNIAVLAGNIILNEGEGGAKYSDINITVKDSETGEIIKTYQPDPVNGLYVLVLPTPKIYTVTYEAYGHLPKTETIDLSTEADLYNLKKVLPLQPVTFGKTGQNYKVMFDTDTEELTIEGEINLETIAETMKKYDEIVAKVIIPNQGDLTKTKEKETILSYLYRNVVDKSRIEIIESAETDSEYEIFLADTAFLNFGNTKWDIKFDKNHELTAISQYKLKQMAYYLKNDNSLCAQIPLYKGKNQDTAELQVQKIYEFINKEDPSIKSQLLVWEADESTRPNNETLELAITDKYVGSVTLMEVIPEIIATNTLIEDVETDECSKTYKINDIITTIYFDFGQTLAQDIMPTSKVINCMLKNNKISVEIIGHTDDIGSAEINQQLSMKRANNIKDYFIKKGIPASQITIKYLGYSKPVAPNKIDGKDNPEGRKLNRRVEIILKSK